MAIGSRVVTFSENSFATGRSSLLAGALAIVVLIPTAVPAMIYVVDTQWTHAFPQTSRVTLSARLRCAPTHPAYPRKTAGFCPVEPKSRQTRWSRQVGRDFGEQKNGCVARPVP